jgi:hypothetical protein
MDDQQNVKGIRENKSEGKIRVKRFQLFAYISAENNRSYEKLRRHSYLSIDNNPTGI